MKCYLQNVSEAGVEANLDTQFAFGLTFPTPGVSAVFAFKIVLLSDFFLFLN